MSEPIASVLARRVWDSRGRPTLEAEVVLECGASGRAIAPAGASRGSREAIDLRDGGSRFGGMDVIQAIASVSGPIRGALEGRDALDQAGIDAALVALDGTPNKASLGGNATVAVSLAVAHAAAAARGLPCGATWPPATRSRCRCPRSRYLAAARTRDGGSTSRISWCCPWARLRSPTRSR